MMDLEEHGTATVTKPARMPEESGAVPREIMDAEDALSRVEGDAQLLAEMASLFLEGCDSGLGAIRASIAQLEARSAARSAHALRGSLASLSATEAVTIAGELEALCISEEYAQASEAYGRLAEAVARLRPALEQVCHLS